MENMYDILAKFNSVDDRHTLTEGRAVKHKNDGDLANNAKPYDRVTRGDVIAGRLGKDEMGGKNERVKEAKMPDANKDGIPDYAQDGKGAKDLGKGETAKSAKPGTGAKKGMSAKQAKYFGGRRPVKESLRVIHEIDQDGVRAMIRHDREYDEYEVCVESDQGVRRAFVNDRDSAHRLLTNLLSERKDKKDRQSWPGSDADDEKTAFRKKHAPSVMRDPESREELSRLDTEYAERKKTSYGRGEEDEDDEEGSKKAPPTGEKRGRGRPKGSKRAIGAKGPTGRSKLLTREQQLDEISSDLALRAARRAEKKGQSHADDNLSSGPAIGYEYMQQAKRLQRGADKRRAKERDDEVQVALSPAKQRRMQAEDYDRDEYDEEGEMAQSQSRTIADAAAELESMLDANENLPEWVQKKITLAQEYIDTARDYLKSNRPEDSDGEMALPEGSTGDYSAKKARAGRDIGRPGKQFAKIAKSAGERYGSKERGEKVAGAVLAKLRAKESIDEADMDESALQAHIGKKKYGKEGMAALQRAGREGAGKAKMDRIRAQHDKLDEEDLEEKAKNPYAVGMAQAMKSTGDRPPLEKSTIKKAHRIARKVDEEDTDTRDQRAEKAGKRVTRDIEYDEKAKDGVHGKKRGSEDDKAERAGKQVARDIEHDEEKPVKETTTAGSVATTPTGGEKKSKGGIQYGKGVYEARLAEQFEREMRKITTEGLDVAITANSDGTNTVTVTGKDVAPDVLQDLLQMAGMSGTREPVYQPVEPAMSGGSDMASMLGTLDGLSAGGDDMAEPMAEPMAEETVCERCGGHEGMHEAGCDREMALEADLANSADRTETMSTDYMVDELAGGLNGPKLQSNPNNPGDNPLAMRRLGRHAGPNLDLGAVVEQVERESEDRLLALYRKIAS